MTQKELELQIIDPILLGTRLKFIEVLASHSLFPHSPFPGFYETITAYLVLIVPCAKAMQ